MSLRSIRATCYGKFVREAREAPAAVCGRANWPRAWYDVGCVMSEMKCHRET